MIVKNEEENIANCLSSVQDIADEIIIVDTGSTDHTKSAASAFTDKIYDFAWINDFAAARNYSYEKASCDYILWLDADDTFLPEDREKFRQLKETLDRCVDTVMMKYNTGFDEHGNVTFSYSRERLTKRSNHFIWHEPVHEYLETGGVVLNSDICVTHCKKYKPASGRNLDIYERILASGGELTPRGLYYYARELKDNGRFAEAAGCFSRFLDSKKGWVEDDITACGELARCFEAMNQPELAVAAILRSFEYDTPRAETCCQLGYFFKGRGEYKKAVFWFELATGLKMPEDSWGFIHPDCWGYIPCIELSVCYDRLGRFSDAERFNDLAGKYKPYDKAVLYNKVYFDKLKSKS